MKTALSRRRSHRMAKRRRKPNLYRRMRDLGSMRQKSVASDFPLSILLLVERPFDVDRHRAIKFARSIRFFDMRRR
jgi:hypothetical protein